MSPFGQDGFALLKANKILESLKGGTGAGSGTGAGGRAGGGVGGGKKRKQSLRAAE